MFDELKNSWKNQQGSDMPGVAEMITSIKKERGSILKRYLGAIFSLLFVIVIFIAIAYFIPFKLMMTKIALLTMGIVILLAVAYLIYLKNQLPAQGSSQESKSYLQEWIDYQEKMKSYSRTFMNIYMVVIIFGMAVYLYEVTMGSLIFRIFAYGLTSLWFIVYWFYLKPRWTKKSDDRIQGIIDHYRSIAEQL